MTEPVAARYRRLSDAFAIRIGAVAPDGWGAPTPCDEWDVRALVDHVAGTQGMFLELVGEPPPDLSGIDDPSTAFDRARVAVQARLDDPEGAAVEFDGHFGRLRFDTAVEHFLCADLVVHGWDLARATGQDETVAPADAEWVLENAAFFGDMLRSPGVAGAEVPVPHDADVQTRMLGCYGRVA